MKERFLTIAVVLSLLAALTACGNSGTTSGSKTQSETTASGTESIKTDAVTGDNITVTIGDQPSFFLLKVAHEKGFFEEEFADDNITIDVINFVNQGSAIVEAMASGDVDLGIIGSLPLVSANANGNEIVALCSANYSEDGFKLIVQVDSEITSVEELKGKIIAVKFASNEHQMLLTLLSNAGLSEDDASIVNMSASDGLSAFVTGDVDAILPNGQTLNAALSAGGTIIADNSETGIITNCLVGRKKFVEENPDITSRVIKVLERAKEYIDENKKEAIEINAAQTDISIDDATVSFESRERAITVDDNVFISPIQKAIEFSLEQKIIDNGISIDDIIDTSYFEASDVK